MWDYAVFTKHPNPKPKPAGTHAEISGYGLHVVQEEEGDFSVWLNTEVSDFDGLIIGQGPTRELAIENAKLNILRFRVKLEELLGKVHVD